MQGPKFLTAEQLLLTTLVVKLVATAALATMLKFSGLKVASLIDSSMPIDVAADVPVKLSVALPVTLTTLKFPSDGCVARIILP